MIVVMLQKHTIFFSLNQLPATEKKDMYFRSIPINPSCFVRALIGIPITYTMQVPILRGNHQLHSI